MKQKFRISERRTHYGLCMFYEALNQEAKIEMWRYFPELKNQPRGVADDSIFVPAGQTRRFLPPLMRL